MNNFNFEKIDVYEVPKEYEKTVDKVREINLALVDLSIEFDGPIINYTIEFKKLLVEELKLRGEDVEIDDFAVFHFIKASSPNPSKIKAFDMDDDFIFELYKKFANSKLGNTLSVQ